MNRVEMDGYCRISKAAARKLYNQGGTVHVVPCKYRPGNNWIAMDLNINDWPARPLLRQGAAGCETTIEGGCLPCYLMLGLTDQTTW